jgi:two-component system LytT family response regulator
MKVLIADDEQPARKKLISLLKSEREVDQIFEAGNGREAIERIRTNLPDLVFLDIQMPGLNGFQVIEEIGAGKMPPTIFVTAYDQYALEAFEVNAIDYLLKPFDRERFLKSFVRAIEGIKLKQSNITNVQSILNDLKKGKKYLERLLINTASRYFFIPVKDLYYISSAEKYIELHTEKGKYLLRDTMNNIESSLDPEKFARIHRSYIVNIEQIIEMQPWSHGDYIVKLKNGAKLQMSRRFKDHLIKT